MSEVKEISRRSLYHEDEGIACGPISITSIMSEIVTEKEGQKIFLYGELVDIDGEYYYEATSESLFDVQEKLNNTIGNEEIEAAIEELDRIRTNCHIEHDSDFEPFYAELKQMIHGEMKEHGLEYIYQNENDEGGKDE